MNLSLVHESSECIKQRHSNAVNLYSYIVCAGYDEMFGSGKYSDFER